MEITPNILRTLETTNTISSSSDRNPTQDTQETKEAKPSIDLEQKQKLSKSVGFEKRTDQIGSGQSCSTKKNKFNPQRSQSNGKVVSKFITIHPTQKRQKKRNPEEKKEESQIIDDSKSNQNSEKHDISLSDLPQTSENQEEVQNNGRHGEKKDKIYKKENLSLSDLPQISETQEEDQNNGRHDEKKDKIFKKDNLSISDLPQISENQEEDQNNGKNVKKPIFDGKNLSNTETEQITNSLDLIISQNPSRTGSNSQESKKKSGFIHGSELSFLQPELCPIYYVYKQNTEQEPQIQEQLDKVEAIYNETKNFPSINKDYAGDEEKTEKNICLNSFHDGCENQIKSFNENLCVYNLQTIYRENFKELENYNDYSSKICFMEYYDFKNAKNNQLCNLIYYYNKRVSLYYLEHAIKQKFLDFDLKEENIYLIFEANEYVFHDYYLTFYRYSNQQNCGNVFVDNNMVSFNADEIINKKSKLKNLQYLQNGDFIDQHIQLSNFFTYQLVPNSNLVEDHGKSTFHKNDDGHAYEKKQYVKYKPLSKEIDIFQIFDSLCLNGIKIKKNDANKVFLIELKKHNSYSYAYELELIKKRPDESNSFSNIYFSI